MNIIQDVNARLHAKQDVAKILGLTGPYNDFPTLAGALLGAICNAPALGEVTTKIYTQNPTVAATTLRDISETARRNFEPGGAATTLLFSRGIHAVMGHRIAHHLWISGNHDMALAVKATCGRVFATDIHPAAQIGSGFWLDHGLGFVAGETARIADDVSIWHNVTLGSTLTDSGPNRHPRIERGAVIGAGAILLGNITIGAGANVAAGAIVVQNVAPNTTVVGAKARTIGSAKVSFTPSTRDLK